MTTFLTQKTAKFAFSTLTLAMITQTSQAVSPATPPLTNLPETTLDTLVVTATRTPTLQDNTLAQTTVVDETDLQRYRGQSVLDVLRGQAGISIKQSGGDGTISNFYLRGFDSKQILVLVDGIRYSSVSAGSAALNLLPADQIDRIEILQGASGSSLYGADAMGGVIQIFTKGQNANQSNVAVTLGAGTQDSYKAQITGQYVDNATTLSLSAGHDKTGGIDATLPTAPFNTHYPDKDGYQINHYSLVAKHQLNDQFEMGVTGLYANSTTDYDSSSTDYTTLVSKPYVPTHSDQKNGAVNTFVNYQQSNLTAQLKYGQSFDKNTSYDAITPKGGKFDTSQKQANLQLGYQLPVGQVMGGAEWLKQTLDSLTKYQKADDRTVKSGFIGYQASQPHYDFQSHVRYDDNSAYGDKTTYNIGGAYRILPSTRLGASYATGFRAPTFNDIEYGVADLKPETSKNTEIFIENKTPLQSTRLTGYHSTINDKIYVNPNNNYLSQNFEKVTIQGLTLTSDWQKDHVLFGGHYTHQTAKNDNGDNKDKHLPYIPENQGLLYVGYQQPKFDVQAEVEHVGKRFTNASNSRSLEDYTLLNVSGNYYVSPQLTLNTRLNNLTDKDYQTAEGYRQKGINALISATYQWF